tara:strand:+ start:34490 stop:35494 length:1005 start_codon:yes stop_codon:yes gene_type:complete
MLNVFYNPSYFKGFQKKVLITKKFKYSIFFDIFVDFLYLFDLPYPNNIIQSGPQMRMNHLIRGSKNNKDIHINKNKSDNNYIIQFDNFGQKQLNEIIKNRNSNTKVLIGPLFTFDMDKKLDTFIKKYSFIKKLVATNSTLEYQKILHGYSSTEHILVCPSGVSKEKDIMHKNNPNKIFDCLIYFKKRNPDELQQIIKFLEQRKLSYNILKYGEYKNKHLESLANNSRFGIVIDKTETQGFAILELMKMNLPLLVWDYNLNFYEGVEIKGTSVPLWDSRCGIKFHNIKEFDNTFNYFINNLDSFEPIKFIEENLTYEKFFKNLINHFENKNNWTI